MKFRARLTEGLGIPDAMSAPTSFSERILVAFGIDADKIAGACLDPPTLVIEMAIALGYAHKSLCAIGRPLAIDLVEFVH